ncbi:MAG: hypothetical protein KAQ90_08675, partial [Melioribacteraceae bacterium]|nr:hypothetical protein [Melioribacteraceae bacterium]
MLKINPVNLMKFCLILIVLIHSSRQLDAQTARSFELISIQDGLSNNSVWAVIQDHYGFLWIATEDGLNKYDGYNFTVFKNDPKDSTSLINNRVTNIFEDSNYDLWITTRGGLSKFNRDNNTFLNYNYINSTSSTENSTWSVVEDKQNNLWVGTSDGIKIFNRKTQKFESFDVMRKDNSLTEFYLAAGYIIVTKDGELYGSSHLVGLVKFDYESKLFIEIKLKNNFQKSFRRLNISQIIEDNEGNILIASNDGLFKINTENLTGAKIELFGKETESGVSGGVSGLLVDKYNNLWIGSISRGLYIYNPENESYENMGLLNSWFTNLYNDKFGNIWLPTDEGLLKFNFDKAPFDLYKLKALDEDNTRPFVTSYSKSRRDKQKIWMGSNKGIYKFDLKKKKNTDKSIIEFKNFKDGVSPIRSILESSDNKLWFSAGRDGLYKYDLISKTLSNFQLKLYDNTSLVSNIVNDLLEFDGNIWAATDFGINIYNKKSNNFTHIPTYEIRVYNLKLLNFIDSLYKNRGPLSSILQAGDFEDITKEFVLTKNEKVIISGYGEALGVWGEMWDYAWLESGNGDTLWTMNEIGVTYYAGG